MAESKSENDPGGRRLVMCPLTDSECWFHVCALWLPGDSDGGSCGLRSVFSAPVVAGGSVGVVPCPFHVLHAYCRLGYGDMCTEHVCAVRRVLYAFSPVAKGGE